MSREVEDVVLRALEGERANVLLVGPAPAAAALLERCVGALGAVQLVTITPPPAPTWARSARAYVDARTFQADDEVPRLLRAALRQDPDVIVVQAARAALPWEALLTTAETGHQVLAHVLDAPDEQVALASLVDVLARFGQRVSAYFRAVLVLDEAGLARVADGDGQVAWRRGEAPLARLPGGRAAAQATEALAFLRQEVERERAPLLIVGPDAAATAALTELAGALRGQHALALPERADDAPWAEGLGPALPWTEHGLEALVRACLRQDPDALVVQAPPGSIPWTMLIQAALTGHQLLVHVRGERDEAALDALRAAAGDMRFALAAAMPWLVVVDDLGPERLVGNDGVRGDVACTVWRRGEPLPARLRDLLPQAAPSPPAFEEPALEPLDPALVERVRALVEPHLRAGFLPVTAPTSDNAARTKLGGRPMLGPGEAWPTCGCGRAMPLAVQLARAELPAEAQVCFPAGAGWLQLFYCSSTGCTVADGWTAAAPNKRLRFLAVDGATPAASMPTSFEDARWSPQDVVSWQRVDETPSNDDLPDLAGDAREDRWALSDRASSRERAAREGHAVPDEPVSDDDLTRLAGPRHGDKLLGWPAWAQGAEWQRCPRCGARMEPLFQVDADEGALEMLFAADGTGHVTQCPTHLDELAFAWACG